MEIIVLVSIIGYQIIAGIYKYLLPPPTVYYLPSVDTLWHDPNLHF